MTPEQTADIIRALTEFGWLIFALIALDLVRPSIAPLFRRVTKAKIFGSELELSEDLTNLQKSSEAAAAEAKSMSAPPGVATQAALDEIYKFDEVSQRILKLAASTPKLALIELGAELERTTLHAVATRGLLKGRSIVPVRQGIEELRQYGFPPNLTSSIDLFYNIRNKIIHGPSTTTDDDVLSAIDSGLIVLRTILAMPAQTNIVYHPGVAVYEDAACSKPMNLKGVILEMISAGGALKQKMIYPTTRTHFQKGKRVAWEWNSSRVFPESWYRDPDTGEIKTAWSQSSEFIGRHLDDL